MSLKICYNNAIHKISKLPENFTGLLKSIHEALHEDLPAKFALKYEDSEGDKIVIHNDEDFKLAIESELSNSNKSLKIYLSDATDLNNTSFITKASVDEINQQQMSQSFKQSMILQAEGLSMPTEEASIPTEEVIISTEEKVPAPQEIILAPQEIIIAPETKEVGSGISIVGVYKSPCKKSKCEKGEKKLSEKTVKKITQETLEEEIPTLAMIVKQMLEDSETEYSSKKRSKKSKKGKKANKNSAVHSRVSCDVCGAFPIIGNRYKCVVLPDYDLCEDCESRVEHKFPLIKIRDESQYPYLNKEVIHEQKERPSCPRKEKSHCKRQQKDEFTSLVDDIVQQVGSLATGVMSGGVPDYLTNLTQVFGGNLNDIVKEFGVNFNINDFKPKEEAPKQESPKEESPKEKSPKEESPKGEEYNATFIKELDTIPAQIKTQDLTIYKTISIKNTGLKTWPKNSFIESESNINGDICKLPSLEAGKEFTTVLVIKSPASAGKFESSWKFGYTDETNNKKSFGDVFNIGFEVVQEKPVEIEVSKPVEVEENLFVEKKEEVPQKKQYTAEVTKLAQGIVEIFPQSNIEEVCEYITQRPGAPFEELVLDFMSAL